MECLANVTYTTQPCHTACKGPPVMNDEERLAAVEGCRFVDEVVPGVPYVMNEAYLRQVMEKYRIDYVVHGDDPCIVDGKVGWLG